MNTHDTPRSFPDPPTRLREPIRRPSLWGQVSRWGNHAGGFVLALLWLLWLLVGAICEGLLLLSRRALEAKPRDAYIYGLLGIACTMFGAFAYRFFTGGH